MHFIGRLVAVVAIAVVAGTACGPQSRPASSSTAEPPSILAGRPILHRTEIGSSWGVVAVDLSGRREQTSAGWGFAWSPDGRSYASFANDHKTVYVVSEQKVRLDVWKARNGETLSIYWPPATWNPDGRRIAVATEDGAVDISERRHWLVVVDTVKKVELTRTELPWELFSNSPSSDPPRNFAWSPDGRYLLINWDRSAVVDASTGAVATLTTDQALADWAGADSVYYLTIGEGRPFTGLYRWDASSAQSIRIAGGEDLIKAGLYASPTAFLGHGLLRRSPDGTKLALLSWKNSGKLPADGETIRVFSLPAASPPDLSAPLAKLDTGFIVMSADWSPDGRYLAYLGFDSSQKASSWSNVRGEIKVLDVTTGENRTIDEVTFPSELSEVVLYAWRSISWST